MAKKSKLPFSMMPASWGLKGKSRAIAEAEYYYDGEELEKALAAIDAETEDEKTVAEIEIDVKNGKFIAVGNVFHQNKLSINLQPGVEQAIVSNNMLSGSEEATLNIGPKDKPKQIIVNSNSFAS